MKITEKFKATDLVWSWIKSPHVIRSHLFKLLDASFSYVFQRW